MALPLISGGVCAINAAFKTSFILDNSTNMSRHQNNKGGKKGDKSPPKKDGKGNKGSNSKQGSNKASKKSPEQPVAMTPAQMAECESLEYCLTPIRVNKPLIKRKFFKQ